ncbi:hypothetical protein LGT41_0014925 [Abyssibius alkaniclasticus]|uniref:hypothetical protein n=1 Tax=Abyssibius alkaniclasticus TaxID=2881234 RepID=UPI002363D95B|nr:hypothetical protein [Abyssibius alkaniclasticus]UPH71057.1 hypothetical protein LGT41_0014925 [Abyssibius alkaniclasticus]
MKLSIVFAFVAIVLTGLNGCAEVSPQPTLSGPSEVNVPLPAVRGTPAAAVMRNADGSFTGYWGSFWAPGILGGVGFVAQTKVYQINLSDMTLTGVTCEAQVSSLPGGGGGGPVPCSDGTTIYMKILNFPSFSGVEFMPESDLTSATWIGWGRANANLLTLLAKFNTATAG